MHAADRQSSNHHSARGAEGLSRGARRRRTAAVGIHREKDFPIKIRDILLKYFPKIKLKEIQSAAKEAYNEYYKYLDDIRTKGEKIINEAQNKNIDIIVLSGRPYHIDPEINHGIDKLISSYNVAIISEDVVSYHIDKFKTTVLNQWTYHSRLYASAKYIADKPNMNLVQLVSFGCGIDAITTDEVREILEKSGKIYTQIKIDEITNLGAVKIRLRSLFAAIKRQTENINFIENLKSNQPIAKGM